MPFENVLIVALDRYIRLLKKLEISPPIFVMLSMIGVKGYSLGMPEVQFHSEYPVDRDTLLLPEGILRDFDDHPDKILQPAFDALWQCVGHERDSLFQDSGEGRWSGIDGKPPV